MIGSWFQVILFELISGEVRCLYRAFKQECPNGIVDEETFKEVYEKIFPLGDATHYAHLVFAAIDRYLILLPNQVPNAPNPRT